MKKGFTLVELIIVVGIIGILAGILLTSFSGGTEKARAAKCLNNMRNLAQASIGYAMKTDRYPAAESYAHNVIEYFDEIPGWISWLSTGDPYHRLHNIKQKVSSFTKVSNVSPFNTTREEWLFAITNGAIWAGMHGSFESYVCPLHIKCAQELSKGTPHWSYVMSANFGYDKTQGSSKGVFSENRRRLGSARLDRMLLFAELPFAIAGSTDSSNEVSADEAYSSVNGKFINDCVLQYKANYSGKSYHGDWSGTAESIAFNHASGKNFFAHVAFADGHTERLMKPKSEGGLNAATLTALLCGGCDITFDGSQYKLATDGDEF